MRPPSSFQPRMAAMAVSTAAALNEVVTPFVIVASPIVRPLAKNFFPSAQSPFARSAATPSWRQRSRAASPSASTRFANAP